MAQDKKNARAKKAEIVFADETGYRYGEGIASTWAPRGQTPQIKQVTAFRRVLSAMVMLSASGKVYKRYFEGSVKSEGVIQSLEHLSRHIRRPVVLIWDNASIHRSKKVKSWLAKHPQITVEYLPPYAPELNPEEYCHGNVKSRMRNGVYHSKAEIRKHLNRGFARLRRRPDLLRSFFAHAGLELAN